MVRQDGADGELKVKWRTKDISAVGGRDFENTCGEIEFKHGEVEKNIEIIINDDLVGDTVASDTLNDDFSFKPELMSFVFSPYLMFFSSEQATYTFQNIMYMI